MWADDFSTEINYSDRKRKVISLTLSRVMAACKYMIVEYAKAWYIDFEAL